MLEERFGRRTDIADSDMKSVTLCIDTHTILRVTGEQAAMSHPRCRNRLYDSGWRNTHFTTRWCGLKRGRERRGAKQDDKKEREFAQCFALIGSPYFLSSLLVCFALSFASIFLEK